MEWRSLSGRRGVGWRRERELMCKEALRRDRTAEEREQQRRRPWRSQSSPEGRRGGMMDGLSPSIPAPFLLSEGGGGQPSPPSPPRGPAWLETEPRRLQPQVLPGMSLGNASLHSNAGGTGWAGRYGVVGRGRRNQSARGGGAVADGGGGHTTREHSGAPSSEERLRGSSLPSGICACPHPRRGGEPRSRW